MQRALTLFTSTVGKKAIMAITGVVLFGYLIGHLAGNLQIFIGREKINEYAHFLHTSPGILWGTRVLLLISAILHIWAAVQLAGRNGEARPVEYVAKRSQKTTYAARTMYWSGPILLLFIVYHLLHLTFGYTSGHYPHSTTDVYANLVSGFRVWYLAAFYVVAQIVLGFHLFHGAWSFFRSLGLNHPKYNRATRAFATTLALGLTLGNISIPLAVQTGLVGDDGLELSFLERDSAEGEDSDADGEGDTPSEGSAQ